MVEFRWRPAAARRPYAARVRRILVAPLLLAVAAPVRGQGDATIDFAALAARAEARLQELGDAGGAGLPSPPEAQRAAAAALFDGVSVRERVTLWLCDGHPAPGALPTLAILTLGAADGCEADDPDLPWVLLQESLCCSWLRRWRDAAERLVGNANDAPPEEREALRRREAETLVRLFRSHAGGEPSLLAVALGMHVFADEFDAHDLDLVTRAIDRLADRAPLRAVVAHAQRRLRLEQFEPVDALLARAADLQPIGPDYARERELAELDEFRERLARARRYAEDYAQAPDDPVLELRYRAVTGALVRPLCERLVARGFEHALPHELLAVIAMGNGDRDAALRELEVARAKPGMGARGAVLLILTRITPLLQRGRDEAVDDPELIRGLRAEFDEALSLVALRPEERRLVQLLSEVSPDDDDPFAAVAADLLMREGAPAERVPHYALLAAALSVHDVAVGLRLLDRAPAEPLRRFPWMMRQRAVAGTALALRADAEQRERAERVLQACLTDARAAGVDGGWLGYLQLVTKWGTDDGAASRRAVAEQLQQLDVDVLERGGTSAYVSSVVARLLAGDEVDVAAVLDRLQQLPERSLADFAAIALGMIAGSQADAGMQLAGRLPEPSLRPHLRLALDAARAVACREHDLDRAREFARSALDSDMWHSREQQLLTRGVLLSSSVRWGNDARVHGVEFYFDLHSVPVLVPPLPSRETLQAIVDTK